MKRIVISGGSGFIGEPLVKFLVARGDDVSVLTRNLASVRAGKAVLWNPRERAGWEASVRDAEAGVTNLVIDDANDRAARLVNQSVDAIVGRSLLDVFVYSRATELWDQCLRVLETRTALEVLVAKLEGAFAAFAFSTGMAALTCLFSLLKPGDRVSFEVLPDQTVRLRKVHPLDVEFAHAVEDTLASEWNSEHDERAYAGL